MLSLLNWVHFVLVGGVKVERAACLRADVMDCGQLVADHVVFGEHEVLDAHACFEQLL